MPDIKEDRLESLSYASYELTQTCREIVSQALDFCEQKTGLRGRETVAAALGRANPAALEYFHYGLAKGIASYLGRTEPSLKAVYLCEPEEMPGEFFDQERPVVQGLDLIAWTVNGKASLPPQVEELEAALRLETQPLLGPRAEGAREFLSVELIDDRDVQERTGRGALVYSIYSRPTRLWSRYVIKLNAEYCGRCRICVDICPFDAITLGPEATAAKLDPDKCQLCGLCFSACPSGAIEAAYYDFSSLVQEVQSSVRAHGIKSIALTCRGSTPTAEEIEGIVGAPDFVPLCLPCVGRIPSEFFLKAVSMGIQRIAVMPCAEGHCRFEDGNRNIRNRVLLLQPLLRALKHSPHLVTFHQAQGPVATVDPELCTGCGTCMSICPYEAVSRDEERSGVLLVAKVDPALCEGCGACISNCPSRAIALSRFADLDILGQIQAALDSGPQGDGHVLGFRCHWCSLGDADLPFDRRTYGENVNVIRVPCVGRIDPLHVLWAFLGGASGVFLGGCPPDNCRYARNSALAEERITGLKQLLESHGLDSRRLQLEWIKRDTPDGFNNALRSFARQVVTLGRATL